MKGNGNSRNPALILSRMFMLAGFLLGGLTSMLQAQSQPASDSIVQITTEANGLQQIAPEQLPLFGTFWLVTSGGPNGCLSVPLPTPPVGFLPTYQAADGQFIVDGLAGETASGQTLEAQATSVVNLINQIQGAQPVRSMAMATAMDSQGIPGFGDTGSGGYGDYGLTNHPLFSFNTNLLWLGITNVWCGIAYANLHNATNQVYAIWSTTNLLSAWSPETEVWPTDTNCMPFTVPTLNRQDLFLRAQDWTGVDSDGDGIPDWWIWKYFGNLSETATNLDSQGNTLGYDYANGFDPNVISFELSATNFYSNTPTVPLQISLEAGNPSCIAILRGDSNVADASWQPYSNSNIVVTLGPTNGDYTFYVGLRGLPTDAAQTWEEIHLTLDTVAPVLIITNQTSGTVMVPIVQVQGYSLEALSGLTYDMTNGAGLTVNQPAFVTAQYPDTNAWKLTTNWFQCFDIQLTNGLNVITLHATDLAGNTATTNLSINLDYSSKTNPPAVQLYWPRNGLQISGSSFLLYGHVDDVAAIVNAQVVDMANDTNVASGVVGRDGVFWIQNLPLSTGTNTLTLTAVDSAGNITVTNIALVQSAVTLTIGSVLAGQTAVSGTISTPGYTVWVNGTNATQLGDGTWNANIVPVTSGNGVVEVTAIPNSDNGGNGSGSDFSGNPMSALAKSASTQVAANSGIHTLSYHYHLHREIPSSSAKGDWTVDWADGGPGKQVNQTWNWSSGYPYIYVSYQWQPTKWPQGGIASVSGTEISFYGSSWQTNSFIGISPPLRSEYTKGLTETHNPFDYNYGAGSAPETIKMDENVDLQLSTGGLPGSTEKHLWCISPNTPNYMFWVGNYEFWTDQTVPPQQISIGTFGQLNANGNAYALIADNSTVDVTPQVKNLDWYSFNLQATEYTLKHSTGCTARDNPDDSRTTIGIGEVVGFYGMPSETIWSVSGNGTITQTNGDSTFFRAKLTPGSATVTATIGSVTIQTTLTILAPDSITVISDTDAPLATEDPSGTQMGAGMYYTDVIQPATVSFANVTFGEQPDTNGTDLIWPSGATNHVSYSRTDSSAVDCDNIFGPDHVTTALYPANYLFNGTSFVNFSWTDTWQDRYKNDAGDWVNFCQMSVTRAFFGSNFKCQITYQGVSGRLQGPY